MDKSRLGSDFEWKLDNINFDLAWKTGTSYGNHDAWTFAYSPEYTVGVWLGNHNKVASPNLIGINAAAPAAQTVGPPCSGLSVTV